MRRGVNVLCNGLRIFDWGDAVLGHPFASLRRGGDLASAHPELGRHEVGARLEHAYVEAWTADVAPADLHRQLRAAPVLGAIAAASTWTRLPAAAVEASPSSIPRKLRELLVHLRAWNQRHTIRDTS
jgi:hypothetical protein